MDNKVRNRSNAVSITEDDLRIGGMDFILDERSRELLTEEERRHTLVRVCQEMVVTNVIPITISNVACVNSMR